MTKKVWKFGMAAAVSVAAAMAQSGGVVTPFQQAGQMGQPSQGPFLVPRPATAVGNILGGGRGSQPVVGKPFSATEERKTVQTLGDGTQIENVDSSLFYRDSQGRTRTEQTTNGYTHILISDPVEHVTLMLDPVTKTARKSSGVVQTVPRMRGGAVPSEADAVAVNAGMAAARSGGGGFGGGGVVVARGGAPAQPQVTPAPAGEELGVQMVNGVAATGTRVTQVIPAGRIGNNRDIHVVNERWYSSDLQMLVKSVNSDPRFGVTTYQVTNIVQGVQDPSLFQVPSDYTVIEPGK